jgi:putative Mn2+ efflux pump MntP
MSPFSILMLGFAMSTDAFAAAIGKGAAMQRPRWLDALRVGLIFGCIEAITPIVGWLIGHAASAYVAAWDHWIAFVLLGGLGLHMIISTRRGSNTVQRRCDAYRQRATPGQRHGTVSLITASIATSIDALAVGVSLALLDVHIGVIAAVIGLCTLTMVTTGIMLGRVLGDLVGKRAEMIGGVILMLVGCVILLEHLCGTG